MSEYSVVLQEAVNGITCDFYSNGLGEFFMTRRQIGEALGYSDPKNAITKIHAAHKERLDRFSTWYKTNQVEGPRTEKEGVPKSVTPLGSRTGRARGDKSSPLERLDQFSTVLKTSTVTGPKDFYLYSAKGVYEICRWSRQPAADAFFDRVYDILEGLRAGTLRASLLPKQDHAAIAMREGIERTVVEWFQTIEAALQSERYYLLPRSSQRENYKPLEQVLGIYDNHFYFIYGGKASELFKETHPTFPRRGFYAVLMAACILAPTQEDSFDLRERNASVGTAVYLYGKKTKMLPLIRKNCPLQLTTIGKNTTYYSSPLFPEDAPFYGGYDEDDVQIVPWIGHSEDL